MKKDPKFFKYVKIARWNNKLHSVGGKSALQCNSIIVMSAIIYNTRKLPSDLRSIKDVVPFRRYLFEYFAHQTFHSIA